MSWGVGRRGKARIANGILLGLTAYNKETLTDKICKNALLTSPACFDTNTTRYLSSTAVNIFQPPHTVLESSQINNISANEVAANNKDTADNNEKSSSEIKEIAEEDTNTDIIKSLSTESSEVAEDTQSEDNLHKGIPPEEVLRKGRFSWIDFRKMYGKIWQDEPVKGKREVLFSFNDVYPELNGINDSVPMHPKIAKDARVQFYSNSSNELRANNIRYEGGVHIPLYNWQEVLLLIQKAKARLGHAVYTILEEKRNKVDAEEEVRKRIGLAIEQCKQSIKVARQQLSYRSTMSSREIKGRLGEDIYSLLNNPRNVKNLAREADSIYYRCVHDLKVLGLKTEPSNKEELGFRGKYAIEQGSKQQFKARKDNNR